MEQNKPHNYQTAQSKPPSKLSIMECANADLEMTDISKDTAENVEGNGNKLSTPPASGPDNLSPASASKRVRLRAASLVGSPSAGRGFGSQSAGFGAGLQNVPSPITTVTTQRRAFPQNPIMNDNVREPVPLTQLPGIMETLKDLAPSLANQTPIMLARRPAPAAENVLDLHPSQGLINSDNQESSSSKIDRVPILNVYHRRADQIGPSHPIPGLGHLGDLLVPPGWKVGEEPIDEAQAQSLFEASRLKAKEMLDKEVGESVGMPKADRDKRSAERSAQYHRQRGIDEYILMERVKLHRFWEGRKNKQSHQVHSNSQQRHQSESKANYAPQPLHPPAETSMVAYQRHQQSLVPASPHLYGPSPPLSGGTLNARIQFMQQGLHIPPASPMSPTFLDPGLVPQTLEAVHSCYARNQVIIMNMNNENERFLTQWSAKFQVPKFQVPESQQSVMPGATPQVTGQRAAPFGSIHHGYMSQESRPWTPSQARFEGPPEQVAQRQQPRPFNAGPNPSYFKQGHNKAPSHPVNRDGPFRYPVRETKSPARKIQAITTPESKKRSRTLKVDKRKPWYADDIAEANLPTSVISQAALKAGMDFRGNGDQKQTPPKPRARRGMPIIDPKKGLAVSEDAANTLIAKGAADARPRQDPITLNKPTNETAAMSADVAEKHGATSQPSTVTHFTSVPILPGDEDTISGPNSGVSRPSSDTPDDPKDTSYGQKAQRKSGTQRNTTASRKVASTTGRKRKSTEGPASAPPKKRTAPSLDRSADAEH
ncbi:hypothetical protein BDR22DRAFT_886795 [Usnea florida]